jgi:ElaB/YqjD/DUF883 family membrane-anchored ribosome-binding protein
MSATLATGSAGNGRAKEAVGTPFDELFNGVDDLIKRVADVENPEIRKIRARVHASMVAAKGVTAVTVAGGANGSPGPAESYFRNYPGQALGVALLVGLGVGLIVSSRQ